MSMLHEVKQIRILVVEGKRGFSPTFSSRH